MRTARTLLVLVSAAATLAACGSGEPAQGPGRGSDASGPRHIHGLGIDPADRSLVIATHTGLFRAAEGQTEARRIGDSRQDTMGFGVVGPRTYLGSGHPALQQDKPPLLGLIRSRDGGRTWQAVSLEGQADFHVLRPAGRRVYGVDSSSGRLLVSGDDGRTWTPRDAPEIVDLAVNPEDTDHVVASTSRGVMSSKDAGRHWRMRNHSPLGLLAWPASGRLYHVDARGSLNHSDDEGLTFAAAGRPVGSEPAAFTATSDRLLVALHDGTVLESADQGVTWRARVRVR